MKGAMTQNRAIALRLVDCKYQGTIWVTIEDSIVIKSTPIATWSIYNSDISCANHCVIYLRPPIEPSPIYPEVLLV